MQICNYGISSVTWTAQHDPTDKRNPGHMPWDNKAVRILIDSRCEIINNQTGSSEWFYLITPCRTEWMYRDDILWQDNPNLEFVGIFSETHHKSGHVQVPDKLKPKQDMNTVGQTTKDLKDFHTNLSYYKSVVELTNDSDVIKATLNLTPIVATTEIKSPDSKSTVVIEYPIKTMNYVEDRERFQVDTGPIIFPDFDITSRYDIEKLQLAFVCYNNRTIAEFVSRVPTPVGNSDTNEIETMEYSKITRTHVKTKLFACSN